MEISLDNIPEQWRMTVNEYASLVKVTRKETYRRMAPGDPDEVTWAKGQRGRTIDASRSLPAELLKRWLAMRKPEQPAEPAPQPAASQGAIQDSGQMDLIPQSKSEEALSDLKARLYRLNPAKYKGIEERFLLIEPLTNHKWAKDASTRSEYVKMAARRAGQHGVSQATVWRWYSNFTRALKESGIDAAFETLAANTPGPLPGVCSSLDDSMKCIVARLWRQGKTRLQCYEGMMAELHEKARINGAVWVYDAPEGPKHPLRASVMRFINAPPPAGLGGDSNPARKGREAVVNAAGYIDRHYRDEYAGETWCIDEWELDGFFYLLHSRSTIVTPYMVSMIDERTTKILGWKLALSLDAETVLDLMEEMVRTVGPPRFLVSDRLGHYRRMLHHKMVATRKAELMDRLAGPLELLGVTDRGPKREKNPRGNRIERVHGIYSDLARRDFGPSWREPLEGKHKVRRVDENKARHLRDHCRLGITGPQLLSFEHAQSLVADWVQEINAADTKANGCDGMTRQAAYLQFQPKEARLRPSQTVVDLAFSQKTERTIRAGGVIQIDGDSRYSSPDLLTRVGEKVMVIRYRRDRSRIFVSFPESRDAVEAALRVPVGTKETARRLEETAKLLEARASLAQEEKPLAAFGDETEQEVNDVNGMLSRSLSVRHPSIERATPPREPQELQPLPYFGGE